MSMAARRLERVFAGDLLDLVLRELVEHDDVVHAVEELGTEHLFQLAHDKGADVLLLLRLFLLREAQRLLLVGDHACADIGGHDDDGVFEIDGSSLAVGQSAVLQNLEQHVEHVGMRLLDLVKEHHRIGLAAHLFGELTALVKADVAGW